jgi:hypothetical protein
MNTGGRCAENSRWQICYPLPHKEEYDAAMSCLQPEEQTKLKYWLVKIIKENSIHNSYALGSKYLNDPELQVFS